MPTVVVDGDTKHGHGVEDRFPALAFLGRLTGPVSMVGIRQLRVHRDEGAGGELGAVPECFEGGEVWSLGELGQRWRRRARHGSSAWGGG